MTGDATPRYEPIAMSSESTVVAEFLTDPAPVAGYQSEADLERAFIKLLEGQAFPPRSERIWQFWARCGTPGARAGGCLDQPIGRIAVWEQAPYSRHRAQSWGARYLPRHAMSHEPCDACEEISAYPQPRLVDRG